MQKSAEAKFLLLTGALVLMLGVQAFRDTFGKDITAVQAKKETLRVPASLPKADASPKPSINHKALMLEWNWNCDSNSAKETSVDTPYLRLKGEACGLELSDKTVSVINETNGYSASIFAIGKRAYETDLIQLREGPNRIRLQYVNSSGRQVETILTVISKISVL